MRSARFNESSELRQARDAMLGLTRSPFFPQQPSGADVFNRIENVQETLMLEKCEVCSSSRSPSPEADNPKKLALFFK
jgi:hypothetical protein